MPRSLLATAVLCALSACIEAPDDLPRASDGGPDLFALEVLDHAGRPHHPDRIPRAVRLQLHTARALDADNEPVMLLHGTLDEALRDDLTRAPLLAAHRPRVWPSVLTFSEDAVTISPLQPLCAGCVYTLVVAGYARFTQGGYVSEEREVTAFELHVSGDVRAGASVTASLPADGASGVPTNLRFVALLLDGVVQGFEDGLWLQAPDDTAVAADVDSVPCAELDEASVMCLVLRPHHALQPLARYGLRTSRALRDGQGTPLAALDASFTTADVADARAPTLDLPTCALDETPLPVGCAVVDDTSASLRVTSSDLARVVLATDSERHAHMAKRGEVQLSILDLRPGQRIVGALEAFDLANHRATTLFSITTERDLPKVSITEVRADPRGPEPAQEFVEVTSYDSVPIALSGFTLSDAPDEPGQVLVTDAVLYPGARVLLVSDAFDPDHPLDTPVPAGTALVRVGKSLASAGLTNAGEPLFLRDPHGRRVSAAPASKAPRAGACLQRVSDDMRSGDPSAFGYDAGGGCTPGQ
jgi:hypothetical protein